MYRCNRCAKVSPAGMKAIRQVTGIRNVSYHNEITVYDEYDRPRKKEIDSVGTEITGEVLVCRICAEAE